MGNTAKGNSARCCVVGGGPAGMMLGRLLAHSGIATIVLEKHREFLRDFRGDTVHPSTLEILAELGLKERFNALPQHRVDRIVSWDDVKLLQVRVDRLERWHRPGLLLIGDAAHAMSPIGGVAGSLNRTWHCPSAQEGARYSLIPGLTRSRAYD